jgi:hypothetical protein
MWVQGFPLTGVMLLVKSGDESYGLLMVRGEGE